MGHDTCCVDNCKNTGVNSACKFYKFPQARWKQEQRMKWITAVKKKNADGSPWYPKPHDKICSAHFIGGKKAEEQGSPSYVPRIFQTTSTSARVRANLAMSRYNRYMERRNKKEKELLSRAEEPNIPYESRIEIMENAAKKIDKGCQIEIFSSVENEGKTFICNRYTVAKKYVILKYRLIYQVTPRLLNMTRRRKTKGNDIRISLTKGV